MPPGPLVADDAVWLRAIERAQQSLRLSAAGLIEPSTPALRVAAVAIRTCDATAPALLGLVRRSLLRADLFSESSLKCLRALARAGEPVDMERLTPFLDGLGRYARTALVAIAERAALGDERAFPLLRASLQGRWAAEAAWFLSSLRTEQSLAVLRPLVSEPHEVGLHASAALLAAVGDETAFRSLTDRLCDSVGSAGAARALLAASTATDWLGRAEKELTERSQEGELRADRGRTTAATLLTVCGQRADMKATLRSLGSSEDQLKLIGAQAAYWLGDADRARTAILELFNRGPTMAAQAFEVLTRWADVGDDRALSLHRKVVDQRPMDLSRAAILEAVAGSPRPVLFGILTRALAAPDPTLALEAARAVARLREPALPVPAYAL